MQTFLFLPTSAAKGTLRMPWSRLCGCIRLPQSSQPSPGSYSRPARVRRGDGGEGPPQIKPCKVTSSRKGLSGRVPMKGKPSYWLPLLGRGEGARAESWLWRVAAKISAASNPSRGVCIGACRVQRSQEGGQGSGAGKVRCRKVTGWRAAVGRALTFESSLTFFCLNSLCQKETFGSETPRNGRAE